MSEFRTAHEHVEAFREAMRAAGVPYVGPIEGDGKLRRVYVEGDRRGKQNGWYKYFDDAHPAGAFGTWKGGNHTWSADKDTCKPMSREDRDEMRRKQAERRAQEARERAEREAKAAAWAQRMWEKAAPAESHPYTVAKGISADGLRVGEFWKESKDGKAYCVAKDALLIPVKDSTRTIVGLQAIYAEPIKVGDEHRGKDFVYGARKQGCWSTIGAPAEIGGVLTIGICEGYATGATAHAATGLGVVVAFDAGNLLHVAREVRRIAPEGTRLVILADNDQWTEKPIRNPGLTKAKEAARDVDGAWCAPLFRDTSERPTDWNDLEALEGRAEVRRQIMAAIAPDLEPDPVQEQAPADEPVREPEPPPIEEVPDGPPEPIEPVGEMVDDSDPPEAFGGEEEIDNPFFTVRGHDRTSIYIYQHFMKLVISRGLSDWPESALTSIAPLHWWETNFPGEKGLNKKMAVNWLQRMAETRGFFDPDSLRGRGAWIDNGRFVYHFGHKLWVDGTLMDVTKIDSTYVYEQGKRLRLPAAEPLSNEDGKRLFEMFRKFGWTREASAILLAGYCALAPVGGALKWRPHVWVTGGAGSGKAQPHTAKVLTPSGWRLMGDLRIGDYVTTPDNGYARVRGVFPQGVKQTYRIRFADGRETRATGDHLWKVRVKGAWRIRTTDEMMEILKRDTRASISLAVPLADPLDLVRNSKTNLPVPPYALGALLGDGFFGGAEGAAADSIKITSADPEIIERMRTLLAPIGVGVFPRDGGIEYRLGDLARYGRVTRSLIKDLRLLGARSADKFIPPQYLEGTVEERFELLRGLMDTDGTVCARGSMSFCTVSPRLRDDVIYLVRSLGGTARYSTKRPTYTHLGEKRLGQVAYNVSIRLRNRAAAFALPRKVSRAGGDYQYADSLYLGVEEIVPDSEEECSCIAIDHPDRLYVTDDFVVTHNTTILNFVDWLMNGARLYAQGNSTEAGIRQSLRTDALPVTFDETEQNNEREAQRMQAVLSLIRQSSTESAAQTLKGTQGGSAMHFVIRSMFCLGSIQVGMKQQADMERISVLELRPKRDNDTSASERWVAISGALDAIQADAELPGKLLHRALRLLPVTIENIGVFSLAAAQKFGSQREGDQYGTLVAGAWSMVSGKVATLAEARAMLDRYNWEDYRDNSSSEESDKALSSLMQQTVRLSRGDVSIGELVMRAAMFPCELAVSAKDAHAALKRHGMKIKWSASAERWQESHLLIANKHSGLERLMEDTPYAADLKGQLLRVPGAERRDQAERFADPKPSKCISIPLAMILHEDGETPAASGYDDFGDEMEF